MKRAIRGLMCVMLSTALVVMAPRAFAQRPPEKLPDAGLVSELIELSWDRGSIPAEVVIAGPRRLIAYSSDPSMRFGALHMTCRSFSDSQFGRCPTSDTGENASYQGSVVLQFSETRSGLTTEISVTGWLDRAESGRGCNDYWQPHPRPLWTSHATPCPTPASGTAFSLVINESDLSRLVAGAWNSTLRLDLRDESGGVLASFEYLLKFTITDHNAVAIYFPQFDEIAPHVGMNLRYDPIAQTVGGGTTVDMCLYDGLGSQAAYLGVTVRDSGGRAPGPLGFSAWHRDSGGSGDSERLDYTVTLDHNGAQVPMRNGVEEQLTGIDSARLKLVLLPGMSQPVFCVPTPLRLEMPRVPIAEKQPGYYRGDLKVELRVPTGVP